MISVTARMTVNVDVEPEDSLESRTEQARYVMIDLLQSGCEIELEEDEA